MSQCLCSLIRRTAYCFTWKPRFRAPCWPLTVLHQHVYFPDEQTNVIGWTHTHKSLIVEELSCTCINTLFHAFSITCQLFPHHPHSSKNTNKPQIKFRKLLWLSFWNKMASWWSSSNSSELAIISCFLHMTTVDDLALRRMCGSCFPRGAHACFQINNSLQKWCVDECVTWHVLITFQKMSLTCPSVFFLIYREIDPPPSLRLHSTSVSTSDAFNIVGPGVQYDVELVFFKFPYAAVIFEPTMNKSLLCLLSFLWERWVESSLLIGHLRSDIFRHPLFCRRQEKRKLKYVTETPCAQKYIYIYIERYSRVWNWNRQI